MMPNLFTSVRTRLLGLLLVGTAPAIAMAQTCAGSADEPPRTTDAQLLSNGDGTVTDNLTGLMWKQCAEGQSGATCTTGVLGRFTLQQALQQPEVANAGSGFAGYTDWRLPNAIELRSLVEDDCTNPAINQNHFPNTPSTLFWAAKPDDKDPYFVWIVDFGAGFIGANLPDGVRPLRLVRSGQ